MNASLSGFLKANFLNRIALVCIIVQFLTRDSVVGATASSTVPCPHAGFDVDFPINGVGGQNAFILAAKFVTYCQADEDASEGDAGGRGGSVFLLELRIEGASQTRVQVQPRLVLSE